MKAILVLSLLLFSLNAFAQFGVSYNQSNLPFVGFRYELLDRRLVPELRVGIDNFLGDNSLELVGTYVVHRREDYGVYAGAGLRINSFEGLVVPVGARVYPFATQRVGLQMELAGLFDSRGEGAILRGSAGMHIRFGKLE